MPVLQDNCEAADPKEVNSDSGRTGLRSQHIHRNIGRSQAVKPAMSFSGNELDGFGWRAVSCVIYCESAV